MFCQRCGGSIPVGSGTCPACGQPVPAASATSTGEEVLATLVPFRNMPALVGYYLAVFSLIPCFGLPLGVGAVFFGVLGLRRHRQQPTAKGSAHAWVAIVLGGFTTLVWGALAALTGFSILNNA